MRVLKLGLMCAALPWLGGCIARTAFDVATAPVRVVSKGVDMATTSQSETDEKRGRELRKQEERRGKLDRQYRKLDERCHDGSDKACAERDKVGREIDALAPGSPGN
ncbi:MAG: hypothetical protein P0Y56_10715 [Candidatus Andeanibacterium colombiense]|uniref:Lipoprotein n=1 Tax=Candidatus Andeanibacterium colombiense TaxID=3121345 RepID=A0AAJ6BLM1_9SPHN|nr:MAG: hypothetical protein P0Y56_10715 [Sphingomonadaceae bacterium]